MTKNMNKMKVKGLFAQTIFTVSNAETVAKHFTISTADIIEKNFS